MSVNLAANYLSSTIKMLLAEEPAPVSLNDGLRESTTSLANPWKRLAQIAERQVDCVKTAWEDFGRRREDCQQTTRRLPADYPEEDESHCKKANAS